MASLLLFGGIAWADQASSDTDTATTGNQDDRTISLSADTGAVVTFPVDIYISCQSNSHMGASTTFSYNSGGSTVPSGGALSATSTTVTRPAGWPADGGNCSGAPAAPKGTSTVSVTAPATAGTYTYVASWSSNDADVSTPPGQINVTITLTANTPAPSDSTPPVLSYLVSGTSGTNGWYTSDVTVTWSVTDPDSTPVIDSGCGVQSFTSESSSITSSCVAHSDGGSSTDSVTFKLDKTGPSAALAVTSGTLGSNGWYTSDVTVTTSGSDSVSGPVVCTAAQNFTADTAGTTVNGSCTNNAGLSTNASALTLKLDKTGPTAALAVTAGTPGTNSWYTSDVTVSTSGSDISPVACSADQFQTTETTGGVFNGSCTNEAGLTTNASPLTVKLDKTGPSAGLTVTAGTTGLNGWYTSDVTVSTSGTDSISSPVACTADQFQTTDTLGTVFNGSCRNDAGLSTNANPLTVKLDKTGPSAALVVTAGTAGLNGWHTSDVTIETQGSDDSPVTCSDPQYQTAETTGTAFNGSCTNEAGLTTNAVPLTVKLDKTAPSVSLAVTAGTAGLNGWYTSDVTVSTSGSDISPVTCTADQYQTDETTGALFNGSCTNEAGLTGNGAPLTVKLDKTGPSAALAVTAGTLGSNGWYTSDVTVSTSGSDISPVTCTPDQYQTDETTGVTFNGSCTNEAGLSTNADALSVKLDKTGPTAALAVTGGAAGLNGWYTSDVTVGASGSDSISSPVGCTPDQYQTTETTGAVFNGSCTNDAGLSTNAAPLTVKLDKTAPELNVSGIAGGTIDICASGVPYRPSYAPADLISLLDGSEGDSWTTPGTASGVGTYTYYAHARNNAGLLQEETRTYNVAYGSGAFSGVLQPINADGTSRFKLGSTIPVKFRLFCGTTPVTNAVARLQVSQVDAKPDPGEAEAISTAASTTGNVFRYSVDDAQYIFNLSTKKGFTNPGSEVATAFTQGTWYLWITLDDGSYHKVNVSLVK